MSGLKCHAQRASDLGAIDIVGVEVEQPHRKLAGVLLGVPINERPVEGDE